MWLNDILERYSKDNSRDKMKKILKDLQILSVEDQTKSKEELLEEIKEMRIIIAELKFMELQRITDLKRQNSELKEKNSELENSLYNASKIVLKFMSINDK